MTTAVAVDVLTPETAKQEHEVGIDFDTVGAEYEDMISKLRRD